MASKTEFNSAITTLQALAPVTNLPAGTILGVEVLKCPWDVAIDSKGHILVSDMNLQQVLVFHRDGSEVRRLGKKTDGDDGGAGDGEFDEPAGIAVDWQGRIFVADRYNDRIQVWNADGTFAYCFGTYGNKVGELHEPRGIAIDKEGQIVVADCWNSRIQVFRPDGSVVRHFGSDGFEVGQLSCPSGVAVDGKGRIVVVDSNNGRVQVFNDDGSVALCFSSEQNNGDRNGPGKFKYPSAVAVDGEGRYVVADSYNHRLQIFNSDGTFSHFIGEEGDRVGQLSCPEGLAIDSTGRIVVAESGFAPGRDNHRVQIF